MSHRLAGLAACLGLAIVVVEPLRASGVPHGLGHPATGRIESGADLVGSPRVRKARAAMAHSIPASPTFAAATPRYAGPQTADMREDLRLLADDLEENVGHDETLTFARLSAEYPPEVAVQALGRILAKGGVLARYHAARLLGQAPGAIPVLILLQEARREHTRTTRRSIVGALRRHGSTDCTHPISEGAMVKLLERIAEDPPLAATSHLVPLLDLYADFQVPLVRCLARIDAIETAPDLKRLLGRSDEVDSEVLGALLQFGVEPTYREKLSRALPRAAERGPAGLGAFQSILYYLQTVAVRKGDALAVRPIFYIVPHAAEPYRTVAMATLHKIAVASPQTFVSGLAALGAADLEEFLPDLVAYLYQKDLDHQFLTQYTQTFRDLDLQFPHHDLVGRLVRAVRDKIP